MPEPEQYREASEDGSTGYSEFCDDDVIMAAPCDTYDTVATDGSSGATQPFAALGKRKSPEDLGVSEGPSASSSYKRRTITSPIDLELATPSSSAPPPEPWGDVPMSLGLGDEHDGPEPYIIAHNASVQRAMDARGLPWGAQWEIARLISLGHCTWNDISIEGLDRLRKEGLSPSASASTGPDSPTPTLQVHNAPIAPYIEDLFRWNKSSFGNQKLSKEIQATSPWEELDREESAFKQHGPTCCLGSTPGLGAWYGGKIAFTMRLQPDKDKILHFCLDHPTLGPSSRFTRYYGSSWLIRVRISKEIFSNLAILDQVKTLILRPIILNGLVFRFFYANKDQNLYLMATNETYLGHSKLPPILNNQRYFCSFLEFFSRHNNLRDNCNQTIAKWASRTALGLSNSIPGLLLDETQIREEVDIVSSSCLPLVKPTSEMDMTDGCGLMNLQASYVLHKELGLWRDAPVAIQCRLAGAKGLLLLHSGKEENSWTYPCVWLRPSQIKIQHTLGYLQNPANRTIDLLRASHMQSPVQISREIIVNLSENGVQAQTFTDLLCQSLDHTISALLHWDVCKEGSVMAARLARESSWTARARGVQPDSQQEGGDDNEPDDNDSTPQSIAWWGDEISGCPSSIEETVMAFLDTGFHPASNAILAEKLHIVAKKAVKTCISKFRVTIPMSCSALIVPDILGVLQEGEIHVKCSQRCLLRIDGQRSDRILGDVLVKAVFKPELDDYVNVIMFSIKGPRSLASMLATGDYDGDRVVCIWQPSIVEQFSNADPKYMDTPIDLQDHFRVKNETVTEFLERPPTSSGGKQIQELQTVLMAPLNDLYVVGTYSTMHDNAIYSLGYSHPTTILLAWIFCTVLDGAKTGKTILPEKYSRDRNDKLYGTQFIPQWKTERDHPTNRYNASRQGLPPFIMDVLRDAMDTAGDEQLRRIADHFAALPPKVKDADLVAPWQKAEARAQEMMMLAAESGPGPGPGPGPEVQRLRELGQMQRDALDAIRRHVVRVHELCSDLMKVSAFHPPRRRPRHHRQVQPGRGRGFTRRSIETRQDCLRRMSREFVSGPPAAETVVFSREDVARLRASYAYVYDWTRRPGGTRFPWNVAMRELGHIKLAARKDFKPISQDFYEKMSMRKF
ncbi:RNA dependent RNA polymerase-domain-containing protein [Russula brevipes]|nr:RNA dependent RNA polymerase-domain-containing protein [Russula brevipes]